jgi:hypothetical protein
LRKLLIGSAFGFLLATGMLLAEVVVKIAPPAAIVETRPVSPGAGYVWVPGYHRWDGNAHVWVAGKWDRPPRPHARWVEPRWRHRKDGYVFVEGRWR